MENALKKSGISLTHAFFTTVGIGAFFFFMRAVGLAGNTYLRSLNLIILFTGIFMGLTKYKKEFRSKFSYINGLLMGIRIGCVTMLMLASSIFLYYLIAPEFIDSLLASKTITGTNSLPSLIGIISIECLSSSILCSYASMQYLRINTHSLSGAQQDYS